MTNTTERVKVTPGGYALGVECSRGHAGNRGLVRCERHWWACQGCGAYRAEADVLADQQRAQRAQEGGRV